MKRRMPKIRPKSRQNYKFIFIMAHVFQLRTKQKINSLIGKGFTFNVPSKWSSGKPADSEIKAALEQQCGKGAGDFSSFSSSKYEVLA